mgnify:CR=1 FL=1
MKVALCFLISYEHILKKEDLWIKWIKENEDIINVYFHYKDIKKIKSNWIRQYSIPPKYIKSTTYYNVVPAYMSILSFAFNHDVNNAWFCLLTDSCVPIISPKKFRQLFLNHYHLSIIKCRPAYWDISIHRRANLRLLSKEFHLSNDPWFTLSRFHVRKCVIFLKYKPGIYNQINMGGLANESIFAIILQTFDEIKNKDRLINEHSSIADWSRMSSPTSPYLFKEDIGENIDIITKLLKQNKYTMFLRKVDKSFPNETLEKLMEMDFNHKYDVLQKKTIFGNTITFFISFFILLLIAVFYNYM